MSATLTCKLGDNNLSLNDKNDQPPSPPQPLQKCPANMVSMVVSELRIQRGIALPMVAMNLAWFAKTAITTAFLGRLGELSLAGGALGFTFANVTGFSVLNGLCGAMEPICGQAHGAKNFRLLHKTLLMAISLLLLVSLPITFLWLNVDKILILFGQQQDISTVARTYVSCLIPDLFVASLFCPLKAYLSCQSITLPTMFSSAVALAFHIPINIVLSRTMGLRGVSMAVWITDLIVVVLLAIYVLILENKKESMWKEGGWWDQSIEDWIRLLKLCGSCCLNTCLEWWCYEILVLLTGHLTNAKQAVGVLAIVLNFDYLLFSVMLSLATCVSTRVSNELGANQAGLAYRSACVSLALGFISGCIGSLVMVAARGIWGPLFSHDMAIIKGVKKTMLLMALVEVFNFPLAVCGGIVRGTEMPNQNLPANVDELLQFISMNVNSDGYDKQLAPVLKQIPPQYYLQSTSDNRDPLDLLDQTIFSLPYTYFLAARCQADRPNTARLIQYILQFLTVFDANQVRLIPDKFLQVAQGLCRLATLYGNGNSVIAIKPLANAIQRYALTPNHLTNLHQMFVKECLLLKCYKQALPILQNDITEIDVQSTAISYTDHLLYHYYGAMIYIGLKNYERALYFLKLVISAPANVTSQIQIEAYKKFTLVSLLLHGKIAQLPKYTANVVFRSVKNQCQAYQDYASAFESLNVKRLRNEFNKWTDAFRKDKNLGLAKQTLDAIYRRNIQQLTQTYLTLSLADIADAVGLEGHDAPKMAESYVLRMIESREIFATISHSHQNGMVSFHDNPDRYDTSLTITQLEEQINKATTVSERVIKTDRIVGCSKEYLQKSQHILAGGAIPGGLGPGDDPDFLGGGGGYENFIDDGKYFS